MAAFFATPVSSAEQLAAVSSISNQAGEIINEHLSEPERHLLATLIDLTITPGQEIGIDMNALAQSAPAIPAEDLFKTLSSLWSKGVLSVKVSL